MGLRKLTTSQPVAALLTIIALLPCAPVAADAGESYDLEYLVTIGDGPVADVSMRVTQATHELRVVRFRKPGRYFSGFRAQGPLAIEGEDRVWTVGDRGGTVSWKASLERTRDNGSVDALRADDWMLLRAEDLFPAIASRTRKGAGARTTMRFELPRGWSVVTPYADRDGVYTVEDQGRRFDHPDGWIIAGDIGVRYDRIANTTVAVAAPRDQSARRLDVMAFMNWHLAHVRDLLPTFPDRLLIVMAGDPFFRGGLSAPNSLFLHTERPLVSGNGTSTLLHELVHVGLGRRAGPGADWIVEGLAEFYSHELLYRSNTVTRRRNRNTRRDLREWGETADTLRTDDSTGAVTARAATVFGRLDAELRSRSGGAYTLDDVVRALAEAEGPMTLGELRERVHDLLGRSADALENENLPGYQ